MRVIAWIISIVVVLIVVAYVGYGYYKAPSKDQFNALKGIVIMGRQYVNDEDIDTSQMSGSGENVELTRDMGKYMAGLQKDNRELKRQKNELIVLAEPRNLAANQTLDVSLDRIDQYDKKINQLYADLESNVDNYISQMQAIKKDKKFMFDTVTMGQKLTEQKEQRANTMKLYLGLSQYIKATLQFAKTRQGYFQLKDDGNVYFTNPADQDYYNKLVAGKNQYLSQIDDLTAQDVNEIRKQNSEIGRAINF